LQAETVDLRSSNARPYVTTIMQGVVLFLLIALGGTAPALATADREIEAARQRWAASPQGPMLERILPLALTPAELPDPRSRGARLLVRYCIQCHHLPSPAMHDAARWPRVVDRMVKRIEGKGNMGALMQAMMGDVMTPDADEVATITAYLRRNAQQAIERRRYPELERASSQSFRFACQQCHVLPEPRRYTAEEWRAVAARMERNMAWMNRIVGSEPNAREPQLHIDEINAFLARYARKR
jgi:mono/diheme cytochrome c family protein